MAAVHPHPSLPTGWFASPLRRGAVVTAVAATVGVTMLWRFDAGTFAALPAAFWVMAALAVGVDARPYVVTGCRAPAVILPSICFTFAMDLAWGLGPALAVQLIAVVVAGARIGQPARRTVHLAVQHVVALAAVAVVCALAGPRLSGLRWGEAGLGLHAAVPGVGSPRWTEAVLTVLAAGAWIAARYAVAALAARCTAGTRRRRRPQRLGAELLATSALLLLGPVVLAAAQVGVALVPLVLLALHAVLRMARAAGEQRQAAYVDALTGLPNRRALLSAVADRAPGGGRRGRRPLTLFLLDLDRFRCVNDALGHALGDRLLGQVADRLSGLVPAHDLVVRLGGDEFAVLATRVDGPAHARRIGGHLAAVLARPFDLDGLPVEVSASIGVARQSDRVEGGAVLLRWAEAAMYAAKERGDDIAVHTCQDDHRAVDRLELLADLRQALQPGGAERAGDGITLYYQPQVRIDTGEVESVEALLRWRHPRRGTVDPAELIRIAEHTAVMRLLTEWVLHEVVAQLADWRAAGRPLRAAVNVSVRDLHVGDIVGTVADLLLRYDVPPELLQLEITEGALMADPHRVLATVTRLDRMGVGISLDDFGTGYSSLQHLRRLPLTEVKIDRSFVLGMAVDAGDAAIVRSVVDLAGALGLRVIAEGVEDEPTWRLLHAAGCDAAQGWFYARPMPADEVGPWLARYRPVPRPQPGRVRVGHLG